MHEQSATEKRQNSGKLMRTETVITKLQKERKIKIKKPSQK